jgi:hypothetical protein
VLRARTSWRSMTSLAVAGLDWNRDGRNRNGNDVSKREQNGSTRVILVCLRSEMIGGMMRSDDL